MSSIAQLFLIVACFMYVLFCKLYAFRYNAKLSCSLFNDIKRIILMKKNNSEKQNVHLYLINRLYCTFYVEIAEKYRLQVHL